MKRSVVFLSVALIAFWIILMGSLSAVHALPTDISDTFTLINATGGVVEQIIVTEADEVPSGPESINGFSGGFSTIFPSGSQLEGQDSNFNVFIDEQNNATVLSDLVGFRFQFGVPGDQLILVVFSFNDLSPEPPETPEVLDIKIFDANGAPNPVATDLLVTSGTAPVPEPTSIILFCVGLAGVGILRRRSKK